MEGATLKLGSIAIEEKIEDNLTEESLKTPWWAKLKKKHEDKMAADQDQEGMTTTEPTYSTFSWMEDTTEEISTKTPIFTPPPSLPTSTYQSNKPLDKVDVWLGKNDSVDVYVKEDIYKTIKKAQKRKLEVLINYSGPIEAPIKKDQVIGKLKVFFDKELLDEYDLLAFKNINKVNIFTRLLKSLNYLIWGDV